MFYEQLILDIYKDKKDKKSRYIYLHNSEMVRELTASEQEELNELENTEIDL